MKSLLTPMEIDLYSSSPLLILGICGVLVLLLDALSRVRLVGRHQKQMPSETSEAYVVSVPGSRAYLMPLSLCGLGTALGIIIWQWFRLDPALGNPSFVLLYQNMLIVDRFSLFASGLCIVFGMLSIATLPTFFRGRGEVGESYALVFFSLVGMMILIMANDWVAMFLGIETLSLGVYVLTGSWRKSAKSSEAALKYFLIGAFVSAILLYGIALMYGATGTTSLRPPLTPTVLLWSIGGVLVLGTLAFKIAAVPFHMWAPDAYEGAPAPVTGFMMAAVKTAAFAFLIRLFLTTMHSEPMLNRAATAFYFLSGLSMLLGNLGALRQTNVKRMLAYSSIAHAGYLLLAALLLRQTNQEGIGVVMYYLLFYGITAVGTMAVVSWVGAGYKNDEHSELQQWEGLSKHHPFAAFAMTILLLSLAGFPPTAGFLAKFYLFRAAFQDKTLWPLIFLAIITSLISVAYYLRIISAMYFRQAPPSPLETTNRPVPFGVIIVVFIATLFTFILGILPNWFFQMAFSATISVAP